MTVAAGGGPAAGGRGRRPLLVAVLALSLVLNLCFIAGAVWIRMHAPLTPAERFRQMGAELNLNPEQQAAFQRYIRAMRARMELMRENVGPLIGSAWAEIAKPDADAAQVMRLFGEAADKRRAYQHEATDQTLQFLATLTPEQRGKFIKIARERRAPWVVRQFHGAPSRGAPGR